MITPDEAVRRFNDMDYLKTYGVWPDSKVPVWAKELSAEYGIGYRQVENIAWEQIARAFLEERNEQA